MNCSKLQKFSVFPVFLMLIAVPAVRAGTVTLDFETPATGSQLISSPLFTSIGKITLSNATDIGVYGPTGKGVRHSLSANPGVARFDFDFNVSSITFDFNGYGGGVFTAQVLDGLNAVINSYFDPSTRCASTCFDGHVTLAGSGIKAMIFADWPGGIDQSFVDNMTIVGGVPEPASIVLFSAGLLAVVGLQWRKRSFRKQ